MFDFPANPTNGQTITMQDGSTRQWDGTKWIAGTSGAIFLPLTGGTLTGPLILAADPTTNLGAATKQYVDTKTGSVGSGYLPLSGGTLTGSLAITTGTLPGNGKIGSLFSGLNIAQPQTSYVSWNCYQDTSDVWRSMAGGGVAYLGVNAGQYSFTAIASSTAGNPVTPLLIMLVNNQGIQMQGNTDITLYRDPTNATHAATKQYVDKMLPLAGGTLTGSLTLAGNASTNLQPVTLQQMNAAIAAIPAGVTSFNTRTGAITLISTDVSGASGLLVTGGTMTGALTLAADPSANLQAATKQYVDTKVTGTFLPLTGGSLSGALSIVAGPVQFVISAATNTDARIVMTRGVGQAATIQAQSSSSPRWQINLADSSNEIGSDAGSNFSISRYTDGGGLKDNTLTISRATGAVTLTGTLTASGSTMTGHTYMATTPAMPADAGYSAMLSVRELVMDGAASAHIAWNSYITNVPNWKYRANGYAAQQWMDSNGAFQWAVYASGSAGALCGTATGSMTLDQIGKLTTSGRAQHGTSVIAAAASGNASMTCWSASAGYAYGMWCGGNALVFGNTDGAGVPATARMILDGSSNLIVNGAVYVSGPTVSNTAYLMSDSNQTVYNFWTNYALQWRRSDGALVYISPAASGNAAMTLTNNGNLTIPGSLNCAGITSSARITSTADMLSYGNVWVAYANNNSFYLASDGTQSSINLMNGYYLTGVYADGSLRYIWNGSTTARMWLDWTGNVTFSGNCYANAYPGPCDIRLKDDVQPFTAGLATLLKLQPSSWRYNGKGGVADDGRRHIGIHAQELSEVLPECIHVLPEAEDRLQEQLAADPMPLLFTVINALREINDRLQSVEKSGISTQINDIVNRITTLEKISGTKTN